MTPNRGHDLLERLFHELFQTETSAARHARREARRLGATPPADALLSVARHAQRMLAELPMLARVTGLPNSSTGRRLGRWLSRFRALLLDRLIDSEKSYRGTLLGLRHGLDLVHLLREVADREGLDILVEWCDDWSIARTPLVEAVAVEMAWFADEPARALRHAGGGGFRTAA